MRLRLTLALLATALVFIFVDLAHAQEPRVANYSIGRYGTKGFEYLSFSEDGAITYSRIDQEREVNLTYLGSDFWRGKKALKVRAPNGNLLYIIPAGLNLRFVRSGRRPKLFRWHYEGPINGRGTACMSCAEDEKEAMGIVRKYFERQR